MSAATHAAEADLRRLRWRARRGLLENDLIISRFLDRFQDQLDAEAIGALNQLLELGDNELLDLLLARVELSGPLSNDATRALLQRMREA